jgi:hypothetical protein
VTIIGFVGADPEQRQARNNNGSKFTVLSVATQRSWKNTDDEWASKTEWHRVCVIWNQDSMSTRVQPRLYKYLESGSPKKGGRRDPSGCLLVMPPIRRIDYFTSEISNSTLISSFTLTVPPAILTGVIPNTVCFSVVDPR